jgi:hypothetical protein
MLLVDRDVGALCLAGDPRQLGPVVRSAAAAAAGLGESMLERLIGYYQALPAAVPARALCTLLVRSYRGHERLLALPSSLFYGSALRACADPAATAAPPWSLLGTARAPSCSRLVTQMHTATDGQEFDAPIGACLTLPSLLLPRTACDRARVKLRYFG